MRQSNYGFFSEFDNETDSSTKQPETSYQVFPSSTESYSSPTFDQANSFTNSNLSYPSATSYQTDPPTSSYQADPPTSLYQADPSTPSNESYPPASSYKAPTSSSYIAPPLAPPQRTPASSEAPPRVIQRKFGYVCEIIVSRRYCIIGEDCDEFGNKLKKNRYKKMVIPSGRT